MNAQKRVENAGFAVVEGTLHGPQSSLQMTVGELTICTIKAGVKVRQRNINLDMISLLRSQLGEPNNTRLRGVEIVPNYRGFKIVQIASDEKKHTFP